MNALFALVIWVSWSLYTYPGSYLIIEKHWQVTLTMIFSSFIAGATSEGGGAIAFPVFTKLLQIAPGDARVFSLAIQSVGMVAASIVILMMRVKVGCNPPSAITKNQRLSEFLLSDNQAFTCLLCLILVLRQ